MSRFSVPREQFPQIYIYEDKHIKDWLKVGYTTKKDAEDRVKEQYNTRLQIEPDAYTLHHIEDSIKDNGEIFTDKAIHDVLVRKGIEKKGEFFRTDLLTVKSTILEIKSGEYNLENRTNTFSMRSEQETAVNLAYNNFTESFKNYPNDKPQFLWNAKMRFGKTFAAYQLAKKMGFKKILVITYKPAVEASWRDDLLSHVDFLEWQFISRNEKNFHDFDTEKPFVYFASFQDLLGTTDDGDVKEHNEWIHNEEWDMIIQDEYHFGAWRDTAKELLDSEERGSAIDEDKKAEELINAKCFLYLSGTPFRAIETGEFTDKQIFNWTYADEQKAKADYVGDNNPYASLPEMTILTYKLPDKLTEVALRGNFNEFNLSYFFKAKGEYEEAEFINNDEVQSWLDMLRGKLGQDEEDDLKMGDAKTPFPLKDSNLRKVLNHMVWFLPDVASAYAMRNLLKSQVNNFYHDYEVVVAAGTKAGSGIKALDPLNEAMGNPLKTKTITLTCGKLTTGVTVKPWTAIFMLRSLNSPESYFQSAFRVQSPWTLPGDNGTTEIHKEQCYVFDFDPNRALSQIATYANKLDTRDINPEAKIQEFIKYLPILAYDGFAMEEIDAAGLLDLSMGQTTSTLLARGWNNALLVNVNSESLDNMANNDEAMKIINSIESFRARKDGTIDKTIISRNKNINRLETKEKKEGLTKTEKKELSDEKREHRSKRKIVMEKLQTLATRIPLFMYMSEEREMKLTDVIQKEEPELFERVTGLTIDDFKLLLELGLFNSELMNNVVYKFKKYEDSSMGYSGINRHSSETKVGGFDEVKDKYEAKATDDKKVIKKTKTPKMSKKGKLPRKLKKQLRNSK